MSPERESGPGRVLLLAYGFLTLASGSRSAVQIGSHFHRAPLAYVLSAVAALVYAANAVLVARSTQSARPAHDRLVRALFVVELAGVVVVGGVSLVRPSWFPDASVWSGFGIGYGLVPLVLPVLGLLWLRSREPVPRRR